MLRPKQKIDKKAQELLYAHKYILYVFYYGLDLALVAYSIKFIILIFDFLIHFYSMSENDLMLSLLGIIDVVMVANLCKMVVTGSYQSFVDKIPENTEKVSSGLLKVKMGTSLIGITSIHLLQIFIKPPADNRDLFIKVGTHIVFLLSAGMLSWIDTIHAKSELYEANAHQVEHSYEVKVEKHNRKCTHEEIHL